MISLANRLARFSLSESPPELLLWWHLKPLCWRLKRQVEAGPYRLDLAAPAVRLAIEVDGKQHNDNDQAIHDAERTRWLNSRGWTVIRFTGREVYLSPLTCAIHAAAVGRKLAKANNYQAGTR